MSDIIKSNFDFSEIFLSSDNGVRRVSTSFIGDWMASGLIQCTRWNFNTSRKKISLYTKTNQWLSLYSNDDNLHPMMFVHIDETKKRLERIMNIRSNGSDSHMQLAIFATLFLLDRGKQVFFEKKMNGRRVDVASTDFEWVIECGDTDDRPILSHLRRNSWTETPCKYVCIIPFQDIFDNPFMYMFERGAKWDDQLAYDIDMTLP